MIRTRVNVAWFLRGIAKRINALAERLDPIKINRPVGTVFMSAAGRASYYEAVRIVERAMRGESVHAPRR